MLRDNANHWLRRGIADFAMAMALFWAVAFYVHGDHNHAHAITVPQITAAKSGGEAMMSVAVTHTNWPGAPEGRGGRRQASIDIDQRQAMFLLSFAFAVIVAVNLAFLRHLRRVYASPRRSVWRGGRID
jgi:LmbE family N-acetylglucosaminyl deacetylase